MADIETPTMGEPSESLRAFLTARSYKAESPGPMDPDYIVSRYYRIPYDTAVPLCLSNDKPPQFVITESSMEIHGKDFRQVRIHIRNEAPLGWMDFAFYSLSETDLTERIEGLEAALLKTWARLFE